MSEKRLREELDAANENRAIVLKMIFDELRDEFGEDRAKELMKRAIYKRGKMIGEKFAQYAGGDFQGLCDAFVGGIPDEGRMFAPEVTKCDEEGLDVTFSNCPLKNAWAGLGLPDEEMATLCEVCGIVDYGTFEGAGFEFEMTALPEGSKDRCYLKIRKKK